MNRSFAFLNTPFVKFLAVGVLNTAFNYVLFAVLVMLGFGPQTALALAFGCGVIWNYFTHGRLVFATTGAGRLVPYALVYLGLYGINAAGLATLLSLGLGPIPAQAVLVLPAAALAFIFISKVLTDRFPWEPKKP